MGDKAFTDEEQEIVGDMGEDIFPDNPGKPAATMAGALFADADKAEEVRAQNRLLGLLIGPKNVEKLRAFGYDIVKVKDGSLTPGVAHRGLTE